MFAKLIATLKQSPKTIVFTEGTDPRILEASARLLSGNFLKPVLVGNPDEIAAAAEDVGFNIRGAEIIDPENYEGMDEMVEKMVELRKGKMTADECRAALKKSNYFGTMLVKMGKADCLPMMTPRSESISSGSSAMKCDQSCRISSALSMMPSREVGTSFIM